MNVFLSSALVALITATALQVGAWHQSHPADPEPYAQLVEVTAWSSGESTPWATMPSPSAITTAIASVPTTMPASDNLSVSAASHDALSACPALIVSTFGARAAEACEVSLCESKWNPAAVGDQGRSLGLFQLWRGWAPWAGYEPEQLLDPSINASVALKVLQHRGRWGGAGGWTCADLEGIW